MPKVDPRQLQLPLDAPDRPSPEPVAPIRATPKTVRLADDLTVTPPPTIKEKQTLPGVVRRLRVGEQTVEYFLRRSKRRTVGFLIDDHGLRVTAPRWLTVAAVEEAITDKQGWILPRLDKRRERLASSPAQPMRWTDGAVVPYLGRDITLRLVRGDAVSVNLDRARDELALTVPDFTSEKQVSMHVQEWMQREALRIFCERMPVYASGLGVSCEPPRLSSAAGRWGSCSPSGRIRLNWRLIHFPLPLIDYVVVHELAHLKEMNHGPRFWAAVAAVFPDHAQAKKTLRERASSVMAIF